jgi:hypothetical protein
MSEPSGNAIPLSAAPETSAGCASHEYGPQSSPSSAPADAWCAALRLNFWDREHGGSITNRKIAETRGRTCPSRARPKSVARHSDTPRRSRPRQSRRRRHATNPAIQADAKDPSKRQADTDATVSPWPFWRFSPSAFRRQRTSACKYAPRENDFTELPVNFGDGGNVTINRSKEIASDATDWIRRAILGIPKKVAS